MLKNWIVVQKLTTKSVPALIEYGETVVGMMTLAAYFNLPNPIPANPALADVTLRLGVLDSTYSGPGGGKTKTDAINVAKNKVLNDLNQLGKFVEITANMPDFQTIGDVVIHAAGMEFKRQGIPKARVFSVIQSPVQQGNIIARTVKALGRPAYEWQFKKVNEVNFQAADITTKASYTYANLQSGTRYQFRVRTVVNGTSNMSQVLEMVVV